MEEELAPRGFVRVHRSRLVRRVAIREIATTPAGDFTLTLDSGRSVAGSRRYRDRI
jgi:DNA-binding LytR/AlgR family response regulator